MKKNALQIAGKAVNLHGSLMSANFRSQRVLCSNPWDYVSLWLKRDHQKDALFYWEQAKHFHDASQLLPEVSSPLTSYYCFLNAIKALLIAKGQEFKEIHGVGGSSLDGKKSLSNEIVDFQGGGILPSLCKYLEEPDNAGKEFTLKEIFWQLPFIQRAYCLTFKGTTELFLPLNNTCFVKKKGSQEAWFYAEITKRYVNSHTKKFINPGFELYKANGKYEIRRKRRFEWSGRDIENSIEQFSNYHKKIRRRIIPIFSTENRWYLKKSVTGYNKLENSQLVLIFAAMHRLSELSRYDPLSFSGHFNVNHNWLLTEFIKASPNQFIYGVASEITGLEFTEPASY